MEEIKRDTALNIYQRMAAITADLNCMWIPARARATRQCPNATL